MVALLSFLCFRQEDEDSMNDDSSRVLPSYVKPSDWLLLWWTPPPRRPGPSDLHATPGAFTLKVWAHPVSAFLANAFLQNQAADRHGQGHPPGAGDPFELPAFAVVEPHQQRFTLRFRLDIAHE